MVRRRYHMCLTDSVSISSCMPPSPIVKSKICGIYSCTVEQKRREALSLSSFVKFSIFEVQLKIEIGIIDLKVSLNQMKTDRLMLHFNIPTSVSFLDSAIPTTVHDIYDIKTQEPDNHRNSSNSRNISRHCRQSE